MKFQHKLFGFRDDSFLNCIGKECTEVSRGRHRETWVEESKGRVGLLLVWDEMVLVDLG